ncbi:transporter substrate-binding domain-containing protein [Kitasatospora sp. NPDC091207]|uniref:transporter substrate-binding domain-containing protein n=1 Tax=Kitasatospora sp. NPDC091207 TaxID=3364083 RepID=UPI0038240978
MDAGRAASPPPRSAIIAPSPLPASPPSGPAGRRPHHRLGRQGKALQVHRFDDDAQALAEVAAGTAVADFNDLPVAAHAARTTDNGNRFEVTGTQSQSGPYGIAVNKNDTALRDALVKGLDELMRNGEYDTILAKWDVSAGGAQAAAVNGGL